MPNSGPDNAGVPVSPRSRAADLHAAFSDPEVKVVLAAIGGDHAAEVLPHLDYGLIRANPKLGPPGSATRRCGFDPRGSGPMSLSTGTSSKTACVPANCVQARAG
jgi:LD-carboxypeptidase N-terminal domain